MRGKDEWSGSLAFISILKLALAKAIQCRLSAGL
jgi:hypothetical protein